MDNDNRQLIRKPTILEVDELADKLVAAFGNPDYRPWYCKRINQMGTNNIENIFARVNDATKVHKGKLFTTLLNQSYKKLKAKNMLRELHGQEKDEA